MYDDIFDLYLNYGHYECRIKEAMDRCNISITKMKKLTGLNHEIVKKYYNDDIIRIDKDVFARMTNVLRCYGVDPNSLLVYIPPKEENK